MPRRNVLHKAVMSRKAPQPVGAYAQAICVDQPGKMLFVSGQIPIELPRGKICTGPIGRQTEICLSHVRNIVLDAGFVMDEVVKCTVYLKDMEDFPAFNEAYRKFFVGAHVPARAAVQVSGLPKDASIEIDAWAVKSGGDMSEIFQDGMP